MIIREVLSALLRRWYIAVSLVGCAALVTVMLARDGGIYTTTTVVSFMRPATTSLSPANGTNDFSVIAFAGAVVQEINNGRPPARYSEEAPYYGAGIREGVLVQLANSGNQWVSAFMTAEVKIQVVGRSFDSVESTQLELVDRVLHLSDALQAAVAAPPGDRISASVVPLTMKIEYVSASRTSQAAAGAAMFAAALIVGTWCSVTVDRLVAQRRLRLSRAAARTPGRVQEGSPS
ncbi:hypothetical protein [Salinibacterium sp. ZJ450]|uniref:hypothetical protein n=1 Tax=Salinibacterium sp. ZJ450 TaxID=2708338 RepID=UPI00141F75A1|nr:hypothetical protein [Salinibacterium sp. ZJ450]